VEISGQSNAAAAVELIGQQHFRGSFYETVLGIACRLLRP
jgi:hypothetical protein